MITKNDSEVLKNLNNTFDYVLKSFEVQNNENEVEARLIILNDLVNAINCLKDYNIQEMEYIQKELNDKSINLNVALKIKELSIISDNEFSFNNYLGYLYTLKSNFKNLDYIQLCFILNSYLINYKNIMFSDYVENMKKLLKL